MGSRQRRAKREERDKTGGMSGAWWAIRYGWLPEWIRPLMPICCEVCDLSPRGPVGVVLRQCGSASCSVSSHVSGATIGSIMARAGFILTTSRYHEDHIRQVRAPSRIALTAHVPFLMVADNWFLPDWCMRIQQLPWPAAVAYERVCDAMGESADLRAAVLSILDLDRVGSLQVHMVRSDQMSIEVGPKNNRETWKLPDHDGGMMLVEGDGAMRAVWDFLQTHAPKCLPSPNLRGGMRWRIAQGR
jgi:hypothetical protein